MIGSWVNLWRKFWAGASWQIFAFDPKILFRPIFHKLGGISPPPNKWVVVENLGGTDSVAGFLISPFFCYFETVTPVKTVKSGSENWVGPLPLFGQNLILISTFFSGPCYSVIDIYWAPTNPTILMHFKVANRGCSIRIPRECAEERLDCSTIVLAGGWELFN